MNFVIIFKILKNILAEASKFVSSVRKSEVASEILKDKQVYRKQIKPYGTPGLTSLSPF